VNIETVSACLHLGHLVLFYKPDISDRRDHYAYQFDDLQNPDETANTIKTKTT